MVFFFFKKKGSWIGFSPFDNYLYVTLGDGGSSNDAAGSGQNKKSFLGKILVSIMYKLNSFLFCLH